MTRIFFIFSFDDSSEYVLLCAKLLEKFDFRGTFYLDIANLRKVGIRNVRELYLSGHEVGSHTVTHRDLSRLPPKEVKWELLESKRFLEEIIECKVKSLAYPFGRFNSRIVGLVREAEYDNARTVEPYLIYGVHVQNRYTLGITFYADPFTMRDVQGLDLPIRAIRSLIKAISRLKYPLLLYKPALLKDYYTLIVNFLEYVTEHVQLQSSIGIHILCHPQFLVQRGGLRLFTELLETLQSYSSKSLTVSEAVRKFYIT